MLALLCAALVAASPTIPSPRPVRAIPLVAPVRDVPGLAFTLSGTVTDSAGAPIAEAKIVVQEANRSTLTDAAGRFRLTDVPEGTYGVSVAAIGFRPRVYRLTVRGRDAVLEARLLPSLVELPTIQTTATPLATSALESPQPLSALSAEALAAAQAPSLGAVLERLPGLRNLSTGAGIGKPVIRGLSSNRVLILDNGQRMETQQWGDEHAPNVETATAERIEVIRGPASVLYGSDALGGVINVIQRELPDATGRGGFMRGHLGAGYAGNGAMPDGALLLEGATGGLGFRGTLSGRTQDDLRTPGGRLANTGLDMLGGSAAVGVRRGWGSLTATVSRRNERVEIHEDPAEEPDATPFQRIGSTRVALAGNVVLGGSRLELDLGAERNRRREFEEAGSDEVALGLLSTTLTANAHLHHAIGPVAGIIGVSAMRVDFEKFGEETLIPGNRADNLGLYAFGQMDAGAWQLSFGARYDHRTLHNDADDALALDAGDRRYDAVTGNAGVLYRLSEPMAIVLNLGRGFRAPSPFELFANGVHEGTVRYEVGDPALRNETSFNTDLAFRVQSGAMQAEIGVFRNAIADYIYPDPTGVTDPGSGFLIYDIAQGDALLTGVEASFDYHPTPWLHLRGGTDYTRGENRTTGHPLAFIAPLRFTGSVRVEGERLGVLDAPYLELGGERNTTQTRLDPDDTAPAGYTLASLSAGTTLPVAGRRLQLDLQVRNLFDATYRSFLSRYKAYADDPGRNISVRVGMAF